MTKRAFTWHRCRDRSRWVRLMLLGAVLTSFAIVGGHAFAAHASDGSNPILGGVEVTDSFGVPLWAYQHLPLDRGGMLDSHSTMTSWLTDAMWAGHVGMVAFGIQLIDWVLGFAWLDWVIAPIDGLTRGVAHALSGIAWAPLALLIAALVGGIIAFRGRVGAGVMQLCVSAGCFALATTVMAAPLTTLTGSDHPISDARALGSELAEAVVADVLMDSGAPLVDTARSSEVAGARAAMATELVTVFVRGAAQETAFGASLSGGQCDEVFTAAMLAEAPGPKRSGVRDAVSACSASAGEYAAQPSLWQPLTVLVTMLGSTALLLLALSLVLGLLGAVLMCGVSAIRAMIWVHVAILPGVGRRKFGRALADMATSLVAIVVFIVLVAGSTALVTNVIVQIGNSGASLAVQMAFVAAMVLTVAIAIAAVRRRLNIAGRSVASALGAFASESRGTSVQPISTLQLRRHSIDREERARQGAETFAEKPRRAQVSIGGLAR